MHARLDQLSGSPASTAWPCPWVWQLTPSTTLPVGCTRKSAPSGHPEPGDVHVVPRAGADHLGEEGDADPHQLAPFAFLRCSRRNSS